MTRHNIWRSLIAVVFTLTMLFSTEVVHAENGAKKATNGKRLYVSKICPPEEVDRWLQAYGEDGWELSSTAFSGKQVLLVFESRRSKEGVPAPARTSKAPANLQIKGAALSVLELDLEEIELPAAESSLELSLLPSDPTRADDPKALGEYNNGYDRDADKFSADAKKRYIEADKTYYAATGKNMDIHSGTRTVARQAELYIDYKWRGKGNPASWPGCSFHNWGLAADMVRTNEKELKAAMNKAGWVQTKLPREPWHYDCTKAAEYSQAKTKIASMRKAKTGLAWNWSNNVAHAFLKSRDFNKRVPPYNERLRKHRVEAQRLQAAIEAYQQRVDRWKSDVARFNAAVQKFNSELARARRLVDEINSMPAGPARDRKIREFRELEAWLKSEKGRLDSRKARLQNEKTQLERLGGQLQVQVDAFKREGEWISKESAALTKLNKEVEKHVAEAKKLLGDIEKAVK